MIKCTSGELLTLLAFGDTVKDIANIHSHHITVISLPQAPSFDLTYKNGVVRSILRYPSAD